MSSFDDFTPVDTPWDLLPGYFSGTADPEERAAVDRWVAADPARGREVEQLRVLWRRTGELPRTPSVDAGWLRVTHALGMPPSRLPDVPELPDDAWRRPARARRFDLAPAGAGRQRPWLRALTRIAAAVALIGSGVLLWNLLRTTAPSPAEQAVAFRDLAATRPGQRATVRLPDGTRVLLGVASTLRIGTGYEECVRSRGDCGRDVQLSGEAYFEVGHNERRPFRVHTAELIVEDLGTAFATAAYPGDDQVRVVVAEGEVAVRSRTDTAAVLLPTLRPGDLARIGRGGTASLEHRVDVDAYLGWTRGELVFEETPIAQVARDLSRWYDLDIQLDSAARSAPALTATFKDQPADHALDLVSRLLDLRYERHGRTVLVTRRHPR